MLLLYLTVLTLALFAAETESAPQYQYQPFRNGFMQHRLNHYSQGFRPGPPRYVSVPRGLQTFGMHARVRESPTLELIFRQRFEGDDETRPIVLVDEPPILLIDQNTVTVAVGEETTTAEAAASTTAGAEETTTTEAIEDDD